MDNNRTALERAFDLAKSGACSSLGDLTRCLRLEGYSVDKIVGPSLSKQLRALIAEAQEQTLPDRPKGKATAPVRRGEDQDHRGWTTRSDVLYQPTFASGAALLS